MFEKFGKFLRGIHEREVDYDRFSFFDHIDHVDKEIIEENFPQGEHEHGIKTVPFKFFRGKNWKKIIKKMRKKKCRPVTLREFGNLIEYPDNIPWWYRRCSLAALGSVYKKSLSKECVVALITTRHGRGREACLLPLDHQWPGYFRFPGVYEGKKL